MAAFALMLRQAATPELLLGRMTSTMRWLSVLPAGPGALLGGWLGEHYSLRSALTFAGAGALLQAAYGWRQVTICGLRQLPRPDDPEQSLGADAGVGAASVWGAEGRRSGAMPARSGPPRR